MSESNILVKDLIMLHAKCCTAHDPCFLTTLCSEMGVQESVT